MSLTDVSKATAEPWTAELREANARGPWGRVALVCAILLASGGVRAWQADRIDREMKRGLESPLSLEDLPMQIGAWKGSPTEIDPQIARRTGGDQVVTRRYVNQETGVSVDAILLFGPAVEMYLHRPELCYPSAGYIQTAGPEDRAIPIDKTRSAPFRSLVYSKGEGAQSENVEVYYTWRYRGRWTPEVGKQKQFERISGMYKVHVARRVTGQERRDVANPNEAFLQALLQEMDRRMAADPKVTS
ncbi:MAG: exosortase-associated EpsI family protein [Isosphaeraceae bacterium]